MKVAGRPVTLFVVFVGEVGKTKQREWLLKQDECELEILEHRKNAMTLNANSLKKYLNYSVKFHLVF